MFIAPHRRHFRFDPRPELPSVKVPPAPPPMHKLYHRIDHIAGSVVTLRAAGVRYRELAEIRSRHGVSLGQVIKLDGESYVLRDWHLRELGAGTVEGGSFLVEASQPVFVVEFLRD
jgi:hypothetical protein